MNNPGPFFFIAAVIFLGLEISAVSQLNWESGFLYGGLVFLAAGLLEMVKKNG